LDKHTTTLKTFLDAMPGAMADAYMPPKATAPLVLMYKLYGKMFAILSVRGDAFVVVKCDPDMADHLRRTYTSIGSRSHLDKRFWISVELGGDVTMPEVKKLVSGSYDIIQASLTRKQHAELNAKKAKG
jgi:predicted DNA-binding protein (MmcQ/YjbR family)